VTELAVFIQARRGARRSGRGQRLTCPALAGQTPRTGRRRLTWRRHLERRRASQRTRRSRTHPIAACKASFAISRSRAWLTAGRSGHAGGRATKTAAAPVVAHARGAIVCGHAAHASVAGVLITAFQTRRARRAESPNGRALRHRGAIERGCAADGWTARILHECKRPTRARAHAGARIAEPSGWCARVEVVERVAGLADRTFSGDRLDASWDLAAHPAEVPTRLGHVRDARVVLGAIVAERPGFNPAGEERLPRLALAYRVRHAGLEAGLRDLLAVHEVLADRARRSRTRRLERPRGELILARLSAVLPDAGPVRRTLGVELTEVVVVLQRRAARDAEHCKQSDAERTHSERPRDRETARADAQPIALGR
jgi:hypothetical protein